MIKYETDRGCIRVDEDVFTNLVGDAATSCFGVRGMAKRSVTDGLVHLLKKESMRKGVHVTYNPDSTISIELHIVIDQGINIPEACRNIIDEVRYKIKKATGVKLKTVDVFVDSALGD